MYVGRITHAGTDCSARYQDLRLWCGRCTSAAKWSRPA